MKKLITTLLLVGGIGLCSKAQWISIPDTNFGKWLNTNGYTACLQGNSQLGWQMDTSCPAVVTATRITCTGSNIRSLTGVRYFDNLDTLICVNNQLTSLPALPSGLVFLMCDQNQLTYLPPLPGGLTHLYCAFNQLTYLPALPSGLRGLFCYNNQIASLPNLPVTLYWFYCHYNQITALPTLPGSLRDLTCSHNLLTSLPVLPGNLLQLVCGDNQLTTLPLIPPNLSRLDCDGNQLTFIPQLPDSMNSLQCSDNPQLNCLPQLGKIRYLYFTNTGIICLTNYPQNNQTSNPPFQSVPLCQPGNLNGCQVALFADAGSDHTYCFGAVFDTLGGSPTASGGTGPYTYSWSPAMFLTCATCPNPVFSPFFDTVTTTYILTVTDSLGATATDTITIDIDPGPVIDSVITSNPTACTGANGAITLTGLQPSQSYTVNYNYNLGPQAPVNLVTDANGHGTVTGLNSGYYINLEVLLNGCISHRPAAGPYILSAPTTLAVNSISGAFTTCGLCDAQVTANVSGGSPPYAYQYLELPIGPRCDAIQCDLLCAGNQYIFIVTDATGCIDSTAFTIAQSSGVQIDSFTTTNVTCGSGNDGSVCVHASGGTPPYSYGWNTIHTTQCIDSLFPGVYGLTVTDANNCSTSSPPFATVTAPPPLSVSYVIMGIAYPDTICLTATGGSPPFNVQWSGNVNLLQNCFELLSGTFSYTITDGNGCSYIDSIIPPCFNQCVWPGDADFNLVADNNDLLPIGLAYGTTGTPRIDQSIGWYAHASANWTDTLLSGTNYKHIDCNGDSNINADDTTAILQNFGFTHAKTDEERGWRMTDPSLFVELTPDTTQAGDTMYANLILGDIGIPASNVYGLAFTLLYNAAVVDSSKTIITFSNSWLGTDTDKISIAKDFSLNGELKCALTRIDHTTRSGFGQIGQAQFVITTDNINGKDLSYYQMDVWLSDLRVIDNLGNEIPVNAGRDSSLIEFEPVGIADIELRNADLKIQPNPASDEVLLTVSEGLLNSELKIMDVEGRVLLQRVFTTRYLPLATHHLANGIYLLQVITGRGTLTKRLVIAR